ncbi:uncharacterized protein LOC129915509 isoform X2 [Episyrphus balteatus]|uniref:uncharacterized protein LOC129915509 isoform X2 n=1 Tax=Episyrphus balteatus TaxID=286459 RepID=UPI002485B89C|nr:uncharacterized protein LOC129915509 isoform X2 [Episyrphus balteatus]
MTTEEFISAIRTNEILWNINHPNFKNVLEKQQIWDEIGSRFNLPTIKCKRKWKGLRATLCRQKLKTGDKDLPPLKGGTKWKYAKDMEFLVPIIKKKSPLFAQENNKNSSESSVESDDEVVVSPLEPPIELKLEKDNKVVIMNQGEQIFQFIEAVKQRPVLWSHNDPNFKYKELKDYAWKEIENLLGIPVENCRKKWKYFKVYLGREISRHPDNDSTWAYFTHLDFVRPFLGHGTRTKPIPDESPKDPPPVVSEQKKDFPEKVIEEVEKNPLLWDVHHKNHKSIYKKMKAWEKIANKLESTIDEVKKKWRGLRDVYSRSYNKNPDEKTNIWPYFKLLMFLEPHLKGKRLNFEKSFERTVSDDDSLSSEGWGTDNEHKMEKVKEEVKEFSNEEFIEVMKEKRILWDSNFNNYKNVKLRFVAWQEVADHFSVLVEDCKKKWRVLRDLFVRNFLKPINEEDKHWRYYKPMQFLVPHIKAEKRDQLGTQSNPSGSLVDEIKQEVRENSIPSISEETQHDETGNDSNEEFINFMKSHEMLWNLSSESYKNKDLRLQAWQEVTDHFAMSNIAECRKKWKALRDAFTRNYYKPIKEEEKSWKYYKQMNFLVPNLKYKRNTPNQDDSCEEPDIKQNGEEEQYQELVVKQELMDEDNYSSAYEEIDRLEMESKEPFCVDEFIIKVKQHEMLWDSNNENYRNNELRAKEWELIAAHFSCSVEECKRKWKALRDSFVRNYFKPIKEKYKNWNYYSQMKFLGPHVKYKKGDSFVGESEFKRRNDNSFSSSFEESKNDENQSSKRKALKKFTVKEFINEIRKHTILWDLNDERCKDRKYRLQAWKQIAAHFSVSSLECKRKWATLRGAFIREFAKYPNNATWENFEELDFLLPYLKANVTVKRELSVSDNGDNNGPSTQQNNEQSFEANEINSANQSIFTSPDQNWIENFILAVEKQTILWDTADINYKKALKRQQAWNTIAKEFGVSINEAKRKWKSLRANFTADLNKYGNNTEENSTTRWKYYKTMTFLCPHLKINNTGEMGYEVNYDSDSCGANTAKFQVSNGTTVDDNSTIEFIQAIKDKELLWNYVDESYKDEMKKKEAWEEIANKFGLSITDCKEKWMALQNGYTRVIVGQANDRKYTWKYCEQMDFLRPFIKTSMDSPNFVEVSGCFSFEDIIEDYSFPDQPGVSKDDDLDDALYEELFECSPSAIVQSIEQNDVQISDMRERVAAKRRKYSDTSSDDEDKEFFHSLKEKMRKLPSYVKCDAKGHIEAYLKVVAANHNVV